MQRSTRVWRARARVLFIYDGGCKIKRRSIRNSDESLLVADRWLVDQASKLALVT
jgi:hypothetical protein